MAKKLGETTGETVNQPMDTMAHEELSGLFAFDSDQVIPAKIRVVGIGGGGGNALNNMIENGIDGIEFVAINTDVQALHNNRARHKIQIGRNRTKGMGAGARSSVGAEAATESQAEIEQVLEGSDMVFITAGMGGGTGTGAAPVVAAIAKRLGILTVAIVTKPFKFEGSKRRNIADEGIRLLGEHVDTLILIPNERLMDISDSKTTITEAFKLADSVLLNATRGISELITIHGMINLDFADIRTTMENGGTSLMGYAMAAGEKRAIRAAEDAITSPLLDNVSIEGARNVLMNITAGSSLTMQEAHAASSHIQEAAGDGAEVIWGIVNDDRMGDDLRITVIATGFSLETKPAAPPKPKPPVELDDVKYKGEQNLKKLDSPAYERRGNKINQKSKTVEKPERLRAEGWNERRTAAPATATAVASAPRSATAAVATAKVLARSEPPQPKPVQLSLDIETRVREKREDRTGELACGTPGVRFINANDLDTAQSATQNAEGIKPAFIRKMLD